MENYFRRRGVWQIGANRMTLTISLALIAFSAPVTAIILVFVPKRNGKKNGYVTTREYERDRTDLVVKLSAIDGRLGDMNTRISNLTIAVNQHHE